MTDDSVLLSDGVISEWADLFNTTGGFKAVCRFITSGVSTSSDGNSNGNSNGNVTNNSITNEIPKNKAIQKNSTTMNQEKSLEMPRQGWKALLRILRVCLSRDPSLVKESVNLSGPLMNIVLNDKEQQQEHEEEEEETINENKNSGKDDMIDATLDGKYSSEGAAREWKHCS